MAAIAALVLLAAGCQRDGGPVATPSVGAGSIVVEGRVTAGPTCPVARNPPASACADRPVAGAVLVVFDAAGNRAAEVTSGVDGSFAIDLPPGTYRLVPQPVTGLMGTPSPLDLVLREDAETSPIVVGYDTGIR